MSDTVPIPKDWLDRLEVKLDRVLEWQHRTEGKCVEHDKDIDDHETRMRGLEANTQQARGGLTVGHKIIAAVAFLVSTGIAITALFLK